MITDMILKVLLLLPNLLLDSVNAVSISIPDGVFNSIDSIFGCLGFICPLAALLPILAIDISLSLFQIGWAIVIRIKSFIPTMGA